MRLIAAGIALVACQEPPTELVDGYGEDCPEQVGEPPGLLIPGLATLPTDGCDSTSLVGVDVQGLWYIEPLDGFPPGPGPIRLTEACGELLATGDRRVERNADRLFWGSETVLADYSYGQSYGVCRVAGDGTLSGWAGDFFEFGGFDAEVDYGRFEARPFGLLPGEAQGDGLELVARWNGPSSAPWPRFLAVNVRVHDGIAYLITREGLRIVDVSDPALPRDLGFHPARDDAYNDVKVIEGLGGHTFAVLGSNNFGVVVVDVSDPARTVEVRRFDPTSGGAGGTHTLFTQVIDGVTWAYFVSGSEPFLGIYDLTDPAVPRAIARYEGYPFNIDWAFHDLYVEGDRAYVNATWNGLLVFDISNRAAPRVIGQTADDLGYSHSNWVTTAGGRKVAVHGDEGFGSFVRIIDVDEDSPEFMQTIGEFRMREQVSVHNIMAVGERAYVAYYQHGLRVLDLSDPTAPQQIAYYNTWDPATGRGAFYEGAFGVDVDARGYIYVADSESGLFILRETR